jgi:hypothetical protein
MMRKFLLIVFFSTFAIVLKSQYYVGGGAGYNMPAGESVNSVNAVPSLDLQFENRSVCWLWFGLHTSYFSTEPPEEYPLALPYYTSILSISPTIRYNPFAMDCSSYKWVPYLKGQINLGIANNTDELDKFGIGTTFGAGLAYSFNLFNQCWMVEGGWDWYSPNNIMLDEGRQPLFINKANIAITWRL